MTDRYDLRHIRPELREKGIFWISPDRVGSRGAGLAVLLDRRPAVVGKAD